MAETARRLVLPAVEMRSRFIFDIVFSYADCCMDARAKNGFVPVVDRRGLPSAPKTLGAILEYAPTRS